MGVHVLAYDIGTTGVKTCLFEIDQTIRMVTSAECGYNLYILENGGAEQDAGEWWSAMAQTTRKVLKTAELAPSVLRCRDLFWSMRTACRFTGP